MADIMCLVPGAWRLVRTCLALAVLCFVLSAEADSVKCGIVAAESFPAAANAADAKGGKLAKIVDALKDDDFDEDEEREGAQKELKAAFTDGAIGDADKAALKRYISEIAAGIQPGFKGGWDDFELAPQPQAWLKSVEADKETKFGVIKSAWAYDAAGKCHWKFTIPEGTKATVCVNGMCKRYAAGSYQLEIKDAL